MPGCQDGGDGELEVPLLVLPVFAKSMPATHASPSSCLPLSSRVRSSTRSELECIGVRNKYPISSWDAARQDPCLSSRDVLGDVRGFLLRSWRVFVLQTPVSAVLVFTLLAWLAWLVSLVSVLVDNATCGECIIGHLIIQTIRFLTHGSRLSFPAALLSPFPLSLIHFPFSHILPLPFPSLTHAFPPWTFLNAAWLKTYRLGRVMWNSVALHLMILSLLAPALLELKLAASMSKLASHTCSNLR